MSKQETDVSCPCGSDKPLSDCCEPLINGVSPASSAEALMRSRYTAYALHIERYLLDSWHRSTRPESIEMDAAIRWLRLKILDSGDDHVEFIATHRIAGKAYKMHEISRFVFEDGRWFYLDGTVVKQASIQSSSA